MHNLIVGNSFSGKTNLCKRFAKDSGCNVIVYDPLSSTGWPGDAIKFSSASEFFKHLETSKNSFVFVDEAKTLWDENPKEADKLLYRRRHQGILVFVIAQRTRMVPPNARNQCSKVFAFKQQKDDAETLAAEYSPALAECSKLEKGHFIMSDGFSDEKMRLIYPEKNPLPPVIENTGEN